ncbi:hypothetical protein [Polaribacter sp. HL-MS24]|uniref:hypothetical protein n=1 Tax=Polaribacter sp. HL-MS24 TaxID=3077735 RepID=UPI0029352DBB|nr:hypothetical protein [Polaribacter sp. HL-MS24]WOC39610.1 hypothetical protein RRF69_08045 [Polaribacter sp. HL-MS24]
MTNTKILLLLIISIFLSCSEDEKETPLPEPPVIKSSEKELISFKFTMDEQNYEAEIRNDSILAVLPSSTDLTKLTPEITISEKATINPASGVLQDFTNLINYNVTAEDNSKKLYKAIITKLNSENKINTFSFTNLAEGQASYSLLNNNLSDIDTISYRVPYLSPIKELISNISISTNATISPQSGETLDYSIPVKYTVTAEDNTTKDYLVIVDNSLGQLDIDGILGNDYRNKKPTESIAFFTNVLNPIKDSIQVKLVSTDDLVNYNLEVQNVNYDNNEVNVKLPDSYNNDNYRFKVFIEHDNFDESDSFTLDGGTPNFKQVDDDNNNVYNTLLLLR